jgi:hypothetical protein
MALRTLYQSFLHSDMGRLRIIARQWGIETHAVKHTDLAAELVDAMVDAEMVMAMLSKLPEDHRVALDDLLRRDAAMPWLSFLRRWGPIREIGMGKMEREELWREPCSAAEALWLQGFVQRDFSEHPSDPIEMAYVPEALRLYIPAPSPLLVPPPQPLAVQVDKRSTDVNDNLAEDLVTWWVAVQKGQIDDSEKYVSGYLLNALHPPANLRAALLKTISLEQGWVRKNEAQEFRLVPNLVLAWLRADLWTQWSSVVRAWMMSVQWHDFAHIPSLHPDPVRDWLPNPLQIRQDILNLLMRCALGEAYSVGQYINYVKEYATDFMRPDGNFDRWAPRDAQTERPLRGYDAWELIEGAYIKFLITGPLSWLGIVDIGESDTGNSADSNFSLTNAGAALFELCDPPRIQEPPKVSIGSGGVINAPARRRYERYQLSRIAQLVNHNNIYSYRMTPHSLKRAQQQHIPLSRIVSFLEQATEHPLPTHLKMAMQRLYDNDEAVRLEHQWLLRLPDPQVTAIPAIQAYILEQLTPSIVVINAQDLERVLDILVENGVLVDVLEM